MSDYEASTYEGLPLFSDQPIARACDPATSQEAAVKVSGKLGKLRVEFVRRLRVRGCPSTANEIAGGDESIRKRAKECLDAGMVVEAGTKSCGVTGQRARAYWVV